MTSRETTILVTGADGFVGTHLCRFLVQKYSVIAFMLPTQVDNFKQKWGSLEMTHLKIVSGEFKDLESLAPLLSVVTHAVHCAGTMLGRKEESYIESNLKTTQNLLKHLPSHLKKLIFISSQSAVGPSPSANYKVKVTDLPAPVSYYGQTKLRAEQEVLKSLFPAIILRPAPILGPEDRTFLEIFQTADRGKFPILGQKQKQFQFVYIHDLIRAIDYALFMPEKNKTYHIAYPKSATWDTMKSALEAHLKRPLSILYLNPLLTSFYLRFYDLREALTGKKTHKNLNKIAEIMAPNWLIDTADFQKDAGFEYTHDMNETISSTYAWYQSHSWTRPSLTR